jgi:hypothetical protein
VRLAYIDETYTDDEFWVIALVIPESGAKELEVALNAVVQRAHARFPEVDPSAELHGYPLDAGTHAWAPLRGKSQARVDIFKEAIAALCGVQGIYLIRACVKVSKLSWGKDHDAHDWALKMLFEKIDREFHNRELVLAICDDVGQREKYRRAFSRFKRDGTGGYQPRTLEAFLDALHFVPSHHSRLVQAVDLAAYVFRRAVIVPPANERSRKFYSDLWNQLSNSVTHRFRIWP